MSDLMEAIFNAMHRHEARTNVRPQFIYLSADDAAKLTDLLRDMSRYHSESNPRPRGGFGQLNGAILQLGERSGVGHSTTVGGTTLEYITWLN